MLIQSLFRNRLTILNRVLKPSLPLIKSSIRSIVPKLPRMTPPRIAIVGAGPAGCTLARILLNDSIPVTIFEGESSPSFRSQGGSLDLHPKTGQAALKECGLFEEFEKYARYDGEAAATVDKNMVYYLKAEGTTKETSRGRPEIDRGDLRKILVESLPKGVIQWGKRIKNVEEGKEDGQYILHFVDGTTASDFDLLVGADGAWSKVRPLVSDAQPYPVGIGGYDLMIPNAAETQPEISALVNRGTIFSFSDGKGICLQQRGDGQISCYAWSVRNENWMQECGYDVHDPAQVRAALEKEYADWKHPLGKGPLVADEKSITPRNLYILPIGHRWKHRTGVTVIGDAAHLMSPFAGEGVNLAMDDSMKLAQAIKSAVAAEKSEDHTILNEKVKAFEEDMFVRAEDMAKLSQTMLEDMWMTPGAPRSSIQAWVQHAIGGKYHDRWWLKILLPQWFLRLMIRAFFRW